LLKQQAIRGFKKQGFKKEEIHIEEYDGIRIPDIAAGNVYFEGGSIDIEKFIEYKERGKKLIYQPYLTSLSENTGKRLKYICTAIDRFCKQMGFIKSGLYSYKLGCLDISMWAIYQKHRYPRIENIKVYLAGELIILKTVPDFMQIDSFLNCLFSELMTFLTEEKITLVKESINQECKNKTGELKIEAQEYCDMRRKHFGVFVKNIIEEKEVEVRKFLEEGYKCQKGK